MVSSETSGVEVNINEYLKVSDGGAGAGKSITKLGREEKRSEVSWFGLPSKSRATTESAPSVSPSPPETVKSDCDDDDDDFDGGGVGYGCAQVKIFDCGLVDDHGFDEDEDDDSGYGGLTGAAADTRNHLLRTVQKVEADTSSRLNDALSFSDAFGDTGCGIGSVNLLTLTGVPMFEGMADENDDVREEVHHDERAMEERARKVAVGGGGTILLGGTVVSDANAGLTGRGGRREGDGSAFDSLTLGSKRRANSEALFVSAPKVDPSTLPSRRREERRKEAEREMESSTETSLNDYPLAQAAVPASGDDGAAGAGASVDGSVTTKMSAVLLEPSEPMPKSDTKQMDKIIPEEGGTIIECVSFD